MKYKQPGNCPYCDSENGVTISWGMSPSGMSQLKINHDNDHPEHIEEDINSNLIQTNISLSRGQYDWIKKRVKISTKTTSMSEIIRNALDAYIDSEHDTTSENCWCSPIIEVMPNGNKVIIHNK